MVSAVSPGRRQGTIHQPTHSPNTITLEDTDIRSPVLDITPLLRDTAMNIAKGIILNIITITITSSNMSTATDKAMGMDINTATTAVDMEAGTRTKLFVMSNV